MAGLGINTVRTYTPPRRDLLDEAARHGLRVMVGLPWSQHVAFLDDRRLKRDDPPRDRSRASARSRDHPAVADVRARQRDSARRRALARPRARRAVPARAVRGREGGGARRAVHLRQLSADRVSRSLVLRSSAPSTSTCTAKRSCAPTWRGCSTSPATSRCCWPKRAPIQHPRRRSGPGRDHGDAHPRGVRRRRVRRDRVRLDRRMVARRTSTSTTGRSGWSIATRHRSRRRAAVATAFANAPFSPQAQRDLAARLGRRLRLQRRRHARGLPDVARAADLSRTTRSSSSTTARAIAPARSARSHPRVRVIDIPNGGLSAARNVGLAAGDRRDRRLHRRRRPRRSRLAHASSFSRS